MAATLIAEPTDAATRAPGFDVHAAQRGTAGEAARLFSRHMRGTIEAQRDGRLHDPARRAAKAVGAARRRARRRPHPRLAAALAPAPGRASAAEADLGFSRWENEGGGIEERTMPVVV